MTNLPAFFGSSARKSKSKRGERKLFSQLFLSFFDFFDEIWRIAGFFLVFHWFGAFCNGLGVVLMGWVGCAVGKEGGARFLGAFFFEACRVSGLRNQGWFWRVVWWFLGEAFLAQEFFYGFLHLELGEVVSLFV